MPSKKKTLNNLRSKSPPILSAWVPPPPPPPPLQLTPILDYTHSAPIANQKWNGTEFVKTDNKAEFVVISDPTIHPLLQAYYPQFKKNLPIFTITNSIYLPGKEYTILNARSIPNYGHTSWFGVAMHFIFMMFNTRDAIEKSTAAPGLLWAFNGIKALLINMRTSPKHVVVPLAIFNFAAFKTGFIGGGVDVDPIKFIRTLPGIWTGNVPQSYYEKQCTIQIHHPITDVLISASPPYICDIFFYIDPSVLAANLNANIITLLQKTYLKAKLLEGPNSVQYVNPTDGSVSYILANEIDNMFTTLPQYFLISLEKYYVTAGHVKQNNNIDISTYIKWDITGGSSITYFLIGIIIHRGVTMPEGTYRALIFDDRKHGIFDYLYYDDNGLPAVIKHMNPNNPIIDKTLYMMHANDTPYLLLYADVNKLE